MQESYKNYFLELPDEVIDLIFYHCAKSVQYPQNNVFVKYEYIMNEPIRARYHDYTGDMANGNPNGRGTMICGTRYTDINPPEYIRTFNQLNVSTMWLYKPFLYIMRKYSLRYGSSSETAVAIY